MRPHKARVEAKAVKPRLPGYLRKKSSEGQLHNFLAGAFAYRPDCMASYDTTSEMELNAVSERTCTIRMPRPDQLAEKKSALDALSEEARYVVSIILNTPLEIIELITTPSTEMITQKRIGEYLNKHEGWDQDKVESVLGEVHSYVSEMPV